VSFFKLGVDGVQEILTLALMIVFIFALLYTEMNLMYKVGIGAIVFAVIFITNIVNQALKQQEQEARKSR
jgi:TM2 domain-containing membrane protein YozV